MMQGKQFRDDRAVYEIVADKLFAAGIVASEGWQERVFTCSVNGCKGNDGKPFASTAMYWLERENRYVPKTVQFGQPNSTGRRRTMFAIGINVAEPLTADRKPNLACAFHAREALKAAITVAGGKPQPDPYVGLGLALRELEGIERAGGLVERQAERGQRDLVNSLVARKEREAVICVNCCREIPLSEAYCPERRTLEAFIDELTDQMGRKQGEGLEMLKRRIKLLVAFYDKHFGTTTPTLVAICGTPRPPKSEGGKTKEPCYNSFLRMVTGNPEHDRVNIGERMERVVVHAREIIKRQTWSALRRAEEEHKASAAIGEWETSVGLGVTISDIVETAGDGRMKTRRNDRRDDRRSDRRGNKRADRNRNGWLDRDGEARDSQT